ncbi:MAG: ribosomal protein S18-alanine N-acetyltransferase [Clostridia bacterium]|nr:ribosomal protein S18-alanine N-acetyltransferase [Clostridia bacterium]
MKTPNGYEIVRICAVHLPQIATLETVCFADPWSEQSLELLLTDSAVGFAAVCEETVVGYGGMMTVVGEGQITNVAVDPACRRMGIGEAILDALLSEAKQRGAEQVALEVRVSNTAAVALYEKCGFEAAGVRKNFYRHPTEDALVMLKPL